MEKVRYVKCEECGRSLPGPPRKCDACDGRMTYRAAENYYTPEGIIPRRDVRKDSSAIPATDFKSKIERRWSGIANAPKIEKPQGAGSGSSKRKRPIPRLVAVAMLLIFLASIVFPMLDNTGNLFEVYETIEDGTVVTTDNYILTMNNVEYKLNEDYNEEEYDSEYDEFTYMGSAVTDLYIYFQVEVTSDDDIMIKPFREIKIDTDGGDNGIFNLVSIYDEWLEEDSELYDINSSTLLKSGDVYDFTLHFIDMTPWNTLVLKHDLGGDFSDHDEDTNIVLESNMLESMYRSV